MGAQARRLRAGVIGPLPGLLKKIIFVFNGRFDQLTIATPLNACRETDYFTKRQEIAYYKS